MDTPAKREKVRQELRELKSQVKSLQQKYDKEVVKHQSLQTEYDSVCLQCQELREQHKGFETHVTDLENQNCTEKEETKRLTKEVLALKNAIKASEQKVSEVDKLELSLDSVKKKLLATQNENRSLESDLHRVQRQLEQSKERLQIAEARSGQSSDKLLDLKKQVQEELCRNKDAQKIKRNFDDLQAVHAKCGPMFSSMTQELDEQKMISTHTRKLLLQEREKRKKAKEELAQNQDIHDELELCLCEIQTLKGLLVGKDALLVQKSQAVSLSREVLTHLDTSGESLELIQYLENINNPQHSPDSFSEAIPEQPDASILTQDHPTSCASSLNNKHHNVSFSSTESDTSGSFAHRKQFPPDNSFTRNPHLRASMEGSLGSSSTYSYDSIMLPPTKQSQQSSTRAKLSDSKYSSRERLPRAAQRLTTRRTRRDQRSISPGMNSSISSVQPCSGSGTTSSSPSRSQLSSPVSRSTRSTRSLSPSGRKSIRTSSPVAARQDNPNRYAVVRPQIMHRPLQPRRPLMKPDHQQRKPGHRRSQSVSNLPSMAGAGYGNSTLPEFPYHPEGTTNRKEQASTAPIRRESFHSSTCDMDRSVNHVIHDVISLEDRILVDLSDDDNPDQQQGLVKFLDFIGDASEPSIGLLLDNKVGDVDGSYKGVRYFDAPPNHGIFVQISQIISVFNKLTLSFDSFEDLLRTTQQKKT